MANSNFKTCVKKIVQSIPKGKTLSYGEVAKQAGNAKAARAVAKIMSQNYDPHIPCHRVICADGSPGGYNRGGPDKKTELLRNEGFIFALSVKG